jgi:hypothetical protein
MTIAINHFRMICRRFFSILALMLFLTSAASAGSASSQLSVQVVPSNGPPTCQLGNHGLVRGRPRIVNGSLVAEDGCLLRTVAAYTGANTQGWTNGVGATPNANGAPQQLSWYQDAVNTGHFNGLRLMIPYDQDPNGCSEGDAFWYHNISGATTLADMAVNFAEQVGLYTIITFTTCPNQFNGNSTWWATMAPRYANRTSVIYELQNELDNGGASGCQIAVDMDSAYQQVRAAAPNTPIIAWTPENVPNIQGGEGCNGGTYQGLLTQATHINYANAVVGWHGYSTTVANLTSFVQTSVSLGYPTMQTEGWPTPTGVSVTDWQNFRQAMEANNTAWSDANGWSGPSDVFAGNITWPKD